MKEKKKTLGLALGAGGSRGACHVGAIQALLENGIEIDYVTGSSMGAVVGGAYASGTDIYQIEKRLLELKLGEIFDMSLRPISSGGLLRGNASERKISPYLQCKTFEETIIPFRCTAVDLHTGLPYVFSEGELIKGMRASMSIPGIFEPVELNDMLLVDGGLLARLPIDAMRVFEPDLILSIDAIGRLMPIGHKPNIISILMRSFEIIDWERTSRLYDNSNEFILTPDIKDLSQLSVKTIPAAIEAGRQIVLDNMDEIKSRLGI